MQLVTCIISQHGQRNKLHNFEENEAGSYFVVFNPYNIRKLITFWHTKMCLCMTDKVMTLPHPSSAPLVQGTYLC